MATNFARCRCSAAPGLLEVDHASRAAVLVELDARGHAARSDLDGVRQCVGQMCHVRARLGVDLAALQAEAAVDAVRAVAERAVDDADRPDAHLDAELEGTAPDLAGGLGDGVRARRVAVRMPPRPVLPGDRQLALDLLVVRQQVVVPDRPVRADAVARERLHVRRVEARRVPGVVHHRPAHSAPGVVLAELDGITTADDPLLRPVQLVRPGLVGDPVVVGVPERSGLDDHDAPAPTREPLREHRPARPGTDDDHVHLVGLVVPLHGRFAGQLARVHVQQEARVVVGRPDGPLEQVAHAHRRNCSGWSATASAGSSEVAPAVSNGSRTLVGPIRMYPRG